MSPKICFLVAVLYESQGTLLRCAIKVDRKDVEDLPEEPGGPPALYAKLHELLPLHVQSCGPVVDAEEIFEVTELK